MTLAFKLLTAGTEVCVGVSAGDGVNVDVRVGMGESVKVAVEEMFVDVEAGCGVEEAGAFSAVHAVKASIRINMNVYGLVFMFPIVLKCLESSPTVLYERIVLLNSSPRPEGGRSR